MRHAHKESKVKEYLPYKLEIMNKEQKERQPYVTPRCTIVPMEEDYLLQAASGNAGKIGHGGEGGDAKRNTGVEDWEEEEASLCPSQGGVSGYPTYNVWGEE